MTFSLWDWMYLQTRPGLHATDIKLNFLSYNKISKSARENFESLPNCVVLLGRQDLAPDFSAPFLDDF